MTSRHKAVRLFFLFSFTLLLLGIFSSLLVAQQNYGKILGTVTDPAGAMIPGAKVTVTNAATHVSYNAETDKDGFYQVLSLPIGNYMVTVEKTGFKKEIAGEQSLLINQNLRIDLKMQVGSNTETVNVEGQNAGVETVSSTLGHSVTGEVIQMAPLNGRNTLDLALLQPGVSETNGGNGGAGNYQIFGGKSDSITFLLDGGINNNLLSNGVVYNPNPDTVAEFKVIASNYSAEYGRNNGGVISVVTKSGSNKLHGSAYDYIRNDSFNANTFFNKRQTPIAPRNILKRHQFGGTIGGPVELPHFNGKDKFFWFFGYQGQRQTATSTGTKTTVFTPAELNGDFSLSNKARTGPDSGVVTFLTTHPFFQSDPTKAAQGIIDPTKIDPIAKNYIKNNLIPTNITGSLVPRGLSTDNNNEYFGKFDFVPTEKDRFALTLGKFDRDNLNALGSGFPQFPTLLNQQRRYLNFGYTRTFTPSLLNEFRATANRAVSNQAFRGVKLPDPTQLGIGITPDALTGPTRLVFASIGPAIGFSNQGPTTIVDDDFSYSDNLTWAKGRHTMKFGWQLIPYDDNQLFDFFIDGEFDFNGSGGIGSTNDRADFLLGLPDAFLQFPAAPSNIRTKASYFYGQDEWRVLPNLTLNLGLRYEYSTPKLDTQGRTFSTVLTSDRSQRFVNAPTGLFFPGDKQAPRGSNFPDRNDFAPRFGFAWDPFNDGKTSIRGGIGVFYDILKGEDNFQFNGQAPFFGTTNLGFSLPAGNPSANYNIMSQPFIASGQPNPFPSKPPTSTLDFVNSGFVPFGGGGVFFVDPHIRTPYTYQYNLTVQRQLPQRMLMELGYVGSVTRKETALIDDNPFALGTLQRLYNALPGNGITPAPGDSTATRANKLNGCPPSPGKCALSFSWLDTFHNVVDANYNGFEASLKKEMQGDGIFGHSFFSLSYSWEKSIDNSSGFRNQSRVPFYNHHLFRSVSAYDLAHRVSFSGGWELPFYKACSGCSNRLTRGWTVFPIFTWRTGFPLDIGAGLSRRRERPGPSGAGDANQVRANFNGTFVTTLDPHRDSTFNGNSGVYWFDPTLFNVIGLSNTAGVSSTQPDSVNNPAVRTYGTLGRNRFFGPGRTNLDFAIGKTTSLWGDNRVNLTIRAEMFNMLNHTEFGNPSTTITSTQFGQISSTSDPRIIQISGRIQF